MHSVVGSPRLCDIHLEQGYSTATHDLISEFYVPSLSASNRYDRAVGYFRSSLFAAVGVALSDFALRGGHFRLVCSPYLELGDIEAIDRGLEARHVVERKLTWEIQQILSHPENRDVVVLLATLISAGCMDIKLACRPSATGIFHAKVGIFFDGDDAVSFVGSSNETLSAWDTQGNHEQFEVFRSWEESARVQRHAEAFERLWTGAEAGVTTYDFPDYPRSQLLDMADIQGIGHSADVVRARFKSYNVPRCPKITSATQKRRLHPHQAEVVRDWIDHDHRGIVKHATGSGKTLSALEAVRIWIKEGQPALIVVPSRLLVTQWRREAETELPSDVIFLEAGGDSPRIIWERALADHTRNIPELGRRVTIATMQTASTDAFRQKVQQGPHLLLVADEVHRIGSGHHRQILGIAAGGRLGLSATPERYGDAEGTELIFDYFGPILQPLFTLGDAIGAGRLVSYDYYVHWVRLAEEEQQQWDEFSDRIAREYARLPEDSRGKKMLTNRFKLLLIRRARIIKQAAGKVDLAASLVKKEFRSGDRWLVYCDDQNQMRLVMNALEQAGLLTLEYHAEMASAREETLAYFQERGGVLVAIRCLDEGVDIPLVNRALILASSSNPREFIQRRGRVLRVAPGKYSATVHDALVLPHGEISSEGPQSAIVRTEIRRALQFATCARNAAVKYDLEIMAHRIGLGPIEGVEFDFEETEEG